MNTKKIFIILLHAFTGWVLCGTVMGVGMTLASVSNAVITHLFAAPFIFAVISYIYFGKFNYTSPVLTALVFVGFVITVDFFLVALIINESLEMFEDPLGTWIPFALIFLVTYVIGLKLRKA